MGMVSESSALKGMCWMLFWRCYFVWRECVGCCYDGVILCVARGTIIQQIVSAHILFDACYCRETNQWLLFNDTNRNVLSSTAQCINSIFCAFVQISYCLLYAFWTKRYIAILEKILVFLIFLLWHFRKKLIKNAWNVCYKAYINLLCFATRLCIITVI